MNNNNPGRRQGNNANNINTNRARGGKRTKASSKRRRVLRTSVLVIGLGLLLTLLIAMTVLIVQVLIKPKPTQPDPYTPPGREDQPGQEDPPLVDPVKREVKKDFFTFLICGTNDNYNVDTIMVGAIDMKTLECNIISIPRDSMIDTTAKIKRINGSYGREGINGLRKAIQGVTGVYPQYYALVNMDNFIKIVDIIGGVKFNVPYNMYHGDADPKYNIDLKAGYQTLDGKKAIQLVRYRGTRLNDFGRINLQKDFLTAMLTQVKNKFSLTTATSIIKTAYKSIKTDMDLDEMIYFYTEAVNKMDISKNIKFYTMPYTGTGKYNGQDYVYLDEKAAVELINKTINPFTTDLTEDDLHIIHLEN